MKPLLVLLAGAALAAGPSAPAWAHSDISGDGATAARSGAPNPGSLAAVAPVSATPARVDASSARRDASPARAGTLPAPPPPEIAVKHTRPSANRVRAVILTVADGEQAEPPARSVFLNCAPAGGSHPSPEQACALLSSANLDPGALRANPTEPCTMIYAPVTVTASGIWDGKYFQFRRTYGNDCEKRSAAGALFNF